MRRIASLMLAAALSLQGGVAAQDHAADLERLQEWVELDQSFSPDARAEASLRIDELLGAAEALAPLVFYLKLASIVALADNGHSNITMSPVYEFGLLPIRTVWFSDGLYIVRTRTEHERLLGARIDAISGHGVEELVERLGIYHGGTDEQFRQYFSTPLLLSPPVLYATHLSASAERVSLSVRLADGTMEQVELAADPPGRAVQRMRSWSALLPMTTSRLDRGWSSYVPSGTEMPLALDESDAMYRYAHLADEGIVYIQLRLNTASAGGSIRDFAADALRRIEEDQPRAIVLDNRYNPGGDLTRTATFARALPSLVPDDGMVYVLTSNATFSAGIYTSFFPKAVDPDKTLVLGERAGDRERFWAETGAPFTLPQTGYRISYSLQMHDLAVGCPVPRVCHLAGRERLDIAVGSLEPDVEIPTTFADYAAGRDPLMEFVLRRVRLAGG